ncbi:MAG: ABC transporter permease [Erysipelotrichia bacterium]|nr:ABC transporter permease [Erysipelotrichia bacterium]NCC55492.1 ABC transporter permease [Erysipelotrichia bacterium]
MLFKLSVKNIRKSLKDYAIYFFTLVLGVAVFYVFNAIDSSAAMIDINSIQRSIIDLLNQMLSSTSIFVCFVLGFLIIYASQFLIKRRKKEFGIYMLLGMDKKELSKILLMETLLIGLLSLVVGLFVGVIASQFMSILVANMFEANMDKFVFTLSNEAMLQTILFFAGIYLIVMLFNTFSISKCKLIDLLNAAKRNEKIKVKKPIISISLCLVSIAMLTYAYYRVTSQGIKIDMDELWIMIVLGCVGTFIFFYSFSGLLLKLIQSNKRLYFKNLNMFVVRQLNSKVNTTVVSMSIICIMLFLTICVLSSGLSIKESISSQLVDGTPVDMYATQRMNIDQHENEEEGTYPTYSQDAITLSKSSLIDTFAYIGFDAKNNLKDIVEYNAYTVDSITMASSLGATNPKMAKFLKEEYPFLAIHQREKLLRVSDYNKIAKLYGKKQFTLAEDEYIILCNYDSMIKLRNKGLKNNPLLSIEGKNFKPKYKTCQDGFTAIASSHTNAGIILLPDDALDIKHAYAKEMVANFNANTQEAYDKIDDWFLENSNVDQKLISVTNEIGFYVDTKSAVYASSVGLGAIGTFVGIYLGIIFLISSAAILALKELSDSSDNKERYTILRKIGVDDAMINKALFMQIGIFFLMPITIAVIHSIFGIYFCMQLLETVGTSGLLPSIVMSALFIVLIYGGYFLITYFCSRNIIREHS